MDESPQVVAARPTLSVIVPTCDGAGRLAEVVGPLLEDPATSELIVVVDGSRDGSIELLEALAETDDRLKPLWVEHGGKLAALEAGLAMATGEIVLLFDDDQIAEPGMVSGHAAHHGAERGLVVVGYYPTVLPDRRRPGQAPARLYAAEYEAACAAMERDPQSILRGLWGGNLSLRREDCLAVGLQSPEFPNLYHEDQDFGIRCQRAGLRGVFDRHLAARHLHERPLAKFLRDSRSQGAGQWMIHQLHADLVGPPRLADFEAGLPAPARWVVRSSRWPALSAAVTRLLAWLAAASGRLRLFGLELTATRLARRVQQQAGARAVASGRGAAGVGRHAIPGARPPVSFLAWTPIQGRSAEIAAALGGEAHCVYYPWLTRRPLVPLRYVLSALATAGYLLRRRPAALIVTNPPLLPGLIGWAYTRLAGAPLVLDSHPGGFGAQNDAVSARLQAVHRWLARRADCCLVTAEVWCDVLERWGATGLVFHEAPPLWRVGPAKPITGRPVVLFAGTFGGDEPVAEVLAAAALVPEMDVKVTGNLARCDPALRAAAPGNVTFTGFLHGDDYVEAVADADIVLTLSTEPSSVMRAAYEAVFAGRPVVLSDWPGLRSLFPHAVHVPNQAEGIAAGLRQAAGQHDALRANADAARQLQDGRWEHQLSALRSVIDRRRSVIDRRRSTSTVPIHVAGLPVSLTAWDELEEWAGKTLAARRSGVIATLAPYQAYLLRHDEDFRGCLARAAVVLIDGNGVRLVVAAAGIDPGPRLTGRELAQRIYAGDFLPEATVAIVGGSPETLAVLADRRPGWALFGERFAARPDDEAVGELAERLRGAEADLVLVALDSPKTLLWADALAVRYPAVYACIGGAVDTAAGVRKAPPPMVTRLGVEWAWRAVQDPSLLARIGRGASVMPGLLLRAARQRVDTLDRR